MKPERRDCLQKMKYGALMGGTVGSAAGFLFGSYEAFRYKGIPSSQVCFVLRRLFPSAPARRKQKHPPDRTLSDSRMSRPFLFILNRAENWTRAQKHRRRWTRLRLLPGNRHRNPQLQLARAPLTTSRAAGRGAVPRCAGPVRARLPQRGRGDWSRTRAVLWRAFFVLGINTPPAVATQ